MTGFAAVLDRWGVDADARRRLLVDNPARVLALSPART
jgi:predicted metal-dependent phosphotriesterase family hydrolase